MRACLHEIQLEHSEKLLGHGWYCMQPNYPQPWTLNARHPLLPQPALQENKTILLYLLKSESTKNNYKWKLPNTLTNSVLIVSKPEKRGIFSGKKSKRLLLFNKFQCFSSNQMVGWCEREKNGCGFATEREVPLERRGWWQEWRGERQTERKP